MRPIATWLDEHAKGRTVNANLALKEQILAKSTAYRSQYHRFKPEDSLIAFLKSV